MSTLHATTFRTLLALATVLFSITPALLKQLGLDESAFFILLYCPALYFVPVVLLAIRPLPFQTPRSAAGAMLFALLVCGSSFLAVFIAISNQSNGLEWLSWPFAGSLGAALTMLAMRFCLNYRVSGLLGWFVPVVSALLSQLISLWLVDVGITKSAFSPYFFPFTILWWWFVGESMLFQQTYLPLLSNQPLHPDALSRAGERQR